MALDSVIVEMDDAEEKNDPATLAAAKSELTRRCEVAGIEAEEHDGFEGEKYLQVALPNGREKRHRTLFSLKSITELLSVPFESYCFLGEYEAICSYSDGSIEALVRGVGPLSMFAIRRQLLRELDEGASQETSKGALTITQSNVEKPISLELASRSHIFRVLSRGPSVSSSAIVLRIRGLTVSQHDRALALLEKLAHSLFFQIDLSTGIALSLVRERRRGRLRRAARPGLVLSATFPQREYDAAPMSLYWYARSAAGMPLLQFLAFYQTLEYYFPTFAQAEAKQKVQSILRDPTFRVDRDADIGRLLGSLLLKGRGFGDERSQLRALITACTDNNDLRAFFNATDERPAFFSAKQKGLTERKLPLGNADVDIRNDVADLIYEIRCRVVHTKGDSADGELELLLPFSREADLLYPYVDLLQYVATKVLITASSPLDV